MKPSTPLRKRIFGEYAITAPSMAWLFFFFVLPTLIIFAIAFRSKGAFGGIGDTWTLNTMAELRNPDYPAIIWRTIWMSFICTLATLAISIPVAYYIARVSQWKRDILLLLTIIPFWTNLLIRIFAWKLVLHPQGMLKSLLVSLHLIEPSAQLLYNPVAVLVVMVYTELPFAILPIYAAAEKFDFSLFEAAMDLGAGRLYAFFHVFLPGIKEGLTSACLMILIPLIGSYVIPDLIGGKDSQMIGNVIVRLALEQRNLPAAAAMSTVMFLIMSIPLLYYLKYTTAAHAKEVSK
ncbi:MAG: ABC transporter permease [Victivallales bacterium]|nr:ABC transporter permease [Victivallales bacterium]